MSDVDKQSNRTMAVAVVCAIGLAGAVGYVAGRGGETAPSRPEVGAKAPVEIGGAREAAPVTTSAPAPPEAAGIETSRIAEKPPARAPKPAAGPRAERTADVAEERPVTGGAWEPGGVGVAETEDPPAPVPVAAPPVVRPIEIPAGTKIDLALGEPVSSQTAQVGQTVVATLTSPIRVDGEIAVPSGTRVVGRISDAKALAKVGGRARLAIDFERLEVAPEAAAIVASWAREGKSETGKDAATIAAGAAIGTVVGNQAKKNDRGKVIGAIVGAGVGTAVAAATPGEVVELPAGARLEVTLRQATVVVPAD